jgi:hypothetical protein
MESHVKRLALLTMFAALVAGAVTPANAATRTFKLSSVHHVFVINLENEGFDQTWSATSPAAYLNNTLRPQGALLTQYYGIGHNSLPNYIAQISGQAPNPQTQGDCQIYSDFTQVATAANGQAVGTGCVYPTAVPTIADQLTAQRLRWKGYMEDMGNSASESATCGHPALNSQDQTQSARVGDQYAARHDPFVYFHSIIDSTQCAADVVPLTRLPADLHAVSTTPNLVYITPNLCDDGHDAPCVDGRPGGLRSADAWLRTWVPRILASPAYKRDGVLIITFDEADATGTNADATSCCGEGPGPNSPLPGITGLGGGRVGALVLSRFVSRDRAVDTTYNQYSLLRTIEDVFDLSHLGNAGASGVSSFGPDVFTGS